MLQQNAVLTFTAKCSMIALSKMLRGGKIMENSVQTEMKFCKHCGQKIDKNVVVCPYCGKQVEILEQAAQPQVVINNSNMNTNTNTNTNVNGYVGRNAKNKWVAFCLCLFLGFFRRRYIAFHCSTHYFYHCAITYCCSLEPNMFDIFSTIPLCTYVHALVERTLCSFFLAESSMPCRASKPCCHPI